MKILVPITNSSDIDVFNPNIYNTEFFFSDIYHNGGLMNIIPQKINP